MKNKIGLKKLLIKSSIFSIIVLSLSLIFNIREYYSYTKNFNNKLSNIISAVQDKYPNVAENEIMEIINSSSGETDIFSKYNIDISKDSIILENSKLFYKNIIFDTVFLLLIILGLVYIFLKYNKKKDKEIENITKLIEEINKKNYKLNIEEFSEDELSILKNEIYKTTLMLKEQAENFKCEKLELKTSLSDISHQLKTPLTSILIILDNLIQDSNMDKDTRLDFLLDIKHEIDNINFLVQSLLKLSKLDTNTVKFNNKKINLKEIINEAVKKLSCITDLKNITININDCNDYFINTDLVWQVEAISNILKNSIEHSKINSSIDISIEDKKVYKEIIIKDCGSGIDKKDLSHIFERFYKGKNASGDSIGIGLALAKSIIEKSNGKILVDSIINKGTTFTIRYY